MIPCDCSKVYIGMTIRTIKTRLKERDRYIHLKQYNKSVIAGHKLPEHSNTPGFYKLARREALKILQYPIISIEMQSKNLSNASFRIFKTLNLDFLKAVAH